MAVSNARLEGFAPFTLPTRSLGYSYDFEKLVALPDNEFRERYVGEMTRSFFEKGRHLLEMESAVQSRPVVLRRLQPICCTRCDSPVDSVRDMVRYHGATLHHECFKADWKKERAMYSRGKPRETAYWDRIARLF